jgi:magnesium-protoporphyrin O-methyltransferase
MLDPGAGGFDHVVAMDSLIHYRSEDVVRALVALGGLCSDSILFTFAPRTPLLAMMHGLGRLFPRQDRAPAIEPAAVAALHRQITRDDGLVDWRIGRDMRVARGFYTSQAQELCRR